MKKYVDQILLDKITFRRFFWDKWKRLIPVCFLSVVVYSIILELHYFGLGYVFQEQRLDIIRAILSGVGCYSGILSHFFGGAIAVNPPLWYVSVLLFCYALFYAITKIAKKVGVNPQYLYGMAVLSGIVIYALISQS